MTAPPQASPFPPPSSPTPRRIKSPRWLDGRLVAGLVLVLASVVLGATLLTRAADTTSVWALANDLQPGVTLSATDLQPAEVKLGAGSQAYLPTTEVVVGQALRRAVGKGELLPRAALVAAANDVQLTTVAIPLSEAVNPPINRGDRVAVWVSTKVCQTMRVLDDITVHDVTRATGGLTAAVTSQLVVRVSPALAERIVTALDLPDATIRAGVLSGPARATANRELPALTGCGARSLIVPQPSATRTP